MSDTLFDMDAVEPAHKSVVDWSGHDLTARAEHPNPCVRLYGFGPAHAICKTCRHLVRRGANKSYLKCKQYKITHGPATDMRANWTACAKYEQELEEKS